MIKTSTTISNKLGLHARASAKLTKLAGSFPCDVFMSRGDRRINAKSIMGVMMLAAGLGTVAGGREQQRTPSHRQIRRGRMNRACLARAGRAARRVQA